MGNLDVDSLFTNITLEEAIDICASTLLENTERIAGLSRKELEEVLPLATKVSYFIFNGKLYKQVDGVVVGSPLCRVLTNAFVAYFKKNCLQILSI